MPHKPKEAFSLCAYSFAASREIQQGPVSREGGKPGNQNIGRDEATLDIAVSNFGSRLCGLKAYSLCQSFDGLGL